MSFFSTVGSLFGWGQGSTRPSARSTTTTFETPSYEDICETRAMLRFLHLPDELILIILDQAEYWPQHTFATNQSQRKKASVEFARDAAATLCLDAGVFNNPTVDPIRKGGEQPKIRALSFEIHSKDQGHTSERTEGTFQTSSWTEVSILRNIDADPSRLPGPRFAERGFTNPSDFHTVVAGEGWSLIKRPAAAEQGAQWGEGDYAWYLQGNRVCAPSPPQGYQVTWYEDGAEVGPEGNEGAGSGLELVSQLQDGDRLLVWARGRVSRP